MDEANCQYKAQNKGVWKDTAHSYIKHRNISEI